jgi:hypothetical protein
MIIHGIAIVLSMSNIGRTLSHEHVRGQGIYSSVFGDDRVAFCKWKLSAYYHRALLADVINKTESDGYRSRLMGLLTRFNNDFKVDIIDKFNHHVGDPNPNIRMWLVQMHETRPTSASVHLLVSFSQDRDYSVGYMAIEALKKSIRSEELYLLEFCKNSRYADRKEIQQLIQECKDRFSK